MKRFCQSFFFALSTCLLTASLFAQQATPEQLKSLKLRSIGPGAMSGRITAIACDPANSNIIYAGAASGGVWRSKSGGTNWEPIFDEAPTQSIGAIAIQPNNPDEIWVGTGEGNPRNSQNFGAGIFRSIDGGKTWTCMGLQQTRTIHRIILHRDNPNIIWAAALGSAYGPNEDRGVYKSTDGGKSWRKVLYVNDLTGCADMVADPSNPNKLIAGMWEYRRWPWFFKSGGKGSGLYVSFDGGETWERRSNKDGLPEGELGRFGLAIAPSNPSTVYALVEAKDNALYKSTDGGKNWRKMADKNQGDRPFYYHELYVDPKDENTIYSVHSVLTKSIDGGRTFDNWMGYWHIHPDHHAFWINPNNPLHIIDGNDGGVNITLDGGKTWRYAENIPVGQFYHINVDDDMPYNIYGGLQDNGSWVGPSAIWKNGGMRNSEWQEVYFGDGFDVMPRKDDLRYCFAMSQGGELGLIDRKTGDTRYLKPVHPEGAKLRFNWNAGIAQDPFKAHGIYFGSQFLHYSEDLGNSWKIISPDLTTADTSKMHQDISGGLTFDATSAENHCTILAIAPSPVQREVVWVGTDDGNLQLTRDGGKTWENFAGKLPDCPKNAWIPQIEVSSKNAGEAFVVVNNYRQNDWTPYLYHTTDYGKKWKRIADAKQITGFCLSVVQDPEVPALLFLGTDQGLYVSFDYGDNWQHWPKESFPSVPVNDMKIQARDADLVLGTFGRAIWIMDNIRPLRAIASQKMKLGETNFKLFDAQAGVLAEYSSYDGPRFAADATYLGDNKGTEVRIPYWVKPGLKAPEKAKDKDKDKKDEKKEDKKDEKDPKAGDAKGRGGKPAKEKATVMVFNMKGDTLRRWKTELDSCFGNIYWGKDTRGVRMPSNNEPNMEQLEPGGGPQVVPGTYKVKVLYMGQSDSVMVTVIDDPRLNVSLRDRQAKYDAIKDMHQVADRAGKAYNRLKEAEKTLELVEKQWVNVPDSLKKETLKLATALKDSINVLKEQFFQQTQPKGIQRKNDNLNSSLYTAMEYINSGLGAPNPTAQIAVEQAKKRAEKLIEQVNLLFDTQWKAYREKAETIKFSLFKDFNRI
jgi:photosystem II stability/assembly factor-like uncharacterized protein